MALNEEKILSNKFIFVSYSHKDSDAVREDMAALLARGVRVWFDENMRLGDDWTEIATRTICHENCVGVLFYNSPNAFASPAVQREQALAKERADQGLLKIFAVHLNEMLTNAICAATFTLLAGDASYIPAMAAQSTMFNDKLLCIMRSDSRSAVERIYQEIAEPYHIVDNENNFMDDAQRSNLSSKDTGELTLGKYIAAEYFGPEQPNGPEDQRFGAQKQLIQLDGKRYTTKDLRWKLMYVKDSRAVLLCTQILSQVSFQKGRELLKNSFCQVAFTKEELDTLGELLPRYLTEKDVERCVAAHQEGALKLSPRGQLAHWWIDEPGLTDYWKQTYSDDFRYEKGFSIFIGKGLRPVLEIPTKSITK